MAPSAPHDSSPDSSVIDKAFEVLSDESRRRVLYYLREHGGTVTVAELREHLSERPERNVDDVSVLLAHMILPELTDSEMVEYDPDGDHVRYDGRPFTTELLEWIGERERTEE